ncbi:MAG: aromatic amino acid lyase [Planctomycetota bacterium]
MHPLKLGHLTSLPNHVLLSPGQEMSIHDLVAVARGDGNGNFARVELGGDWRARCQQSADYVKRIVHETMGKTREQLAGISRDRLKSPPNETEERLARKALVYGVTTGFGSFKSHAMKDSAAATQMQRNLLRSHATGAGPPLPTETVRAMMLIRARTFVEGYSGVRPEIVEFLVELLNRRVHPWVPAQGSVGSSGDLCPLSHMSLILIGEGLAWLDDRETTTGYTWSANSAKSKSETESSWDVRLDKRPAPRPAAEILQDAGLSDRVLHDLQPKEGLALTNGTCATTALAALAVYDAHSLYGTANLAVALSLQSMLGATRALDPKVHALRRHVGQSEAAQQILSFATGGNLLDTSGDVQDVYSLRCAPAVHGAAHHAINHVWETVEREINAVTDNPLFFDAKKDGPPLDGYSTCIWDAYSGGNFHGEPIGLVADYLKIAVAELGNISERRTQCLLDAHHNRGLPANLWPDKSTAGLNSGLMIAQYLAASLVSENKILCHPASVDSIPTSGNIEDHVAMAPIAARHARQVNQNVRQVLAVELLAALAALEIRLSHPTSTTPPKANPVALAVLNLIRSGGNFHPPVKPLVGEDRELWPDIAAIALTIETGELLRVAQSAISGDHPVVRS